MKVNKGTPYSKKDFTVIEKSIGRKLTAEHREKLNYSKLRWEASKALLPARIPTEKELQEIRRKKIDDIKNRIADLIELLESDGHLISWHDSYDRMTDQLYLALRFTETAQKEKGKPSKKVVARKGRMPEVYRATFILELAEIFENITGEKAAAPAYNDYIGTYICKNAFLDFAVSCVRPIEETQPGPIASAIKKAFAENKKHPRNTIRFKNNFGEPNKNQIFPE